MKSLRNLTAIALTAVLAFAFAGCSQDAGDSPAPHEHAFAAEWTSNETHHWHAATCGHDVKKDEAPHEWDHEDFQFDAASGKEIKTCTVCGFVADKNHAHTEDSGTVTPPTCVTKGVKTYKCTVCDKVLRTEEIPATGHTEDSGTVTTAPTCTEKGLRTYKCTACDKVLRTEEIPATGHTEDTGTVTTAVTLNTDGVRTYKCTVCDEVLRTEPIKKPELYSSPIDAETGLAATKSSKYIYFGVFPKTVAAKTITVDENVSVTMGANTYYKGKNDENYYVEVKENALHYSKEYNYSDNTWPGTSYRWFKVEPIKWKVITDSYSGKCLLLAEDILTANVPYYAETAKRTIAGETVHPNNYKYSQIRAYLNGLDYYYGDILGSIVKKTDYTDKGFLQTAFTAEAQNLIAVTTVDNSAASTTDSGNNLDEATEYACEDTKDKIFLLSLKEATSYGFPAYNEGGDARIRKTTDYAKANYAYQDPFAGCGGYWWLRSPGYEGVYYDRDIARIVYYGGNASTSRYVYNNSYGVVPALSISLQ